MLLMELAAVAYAMEVLIGDIGTWKEHSIS